jgi:hypothetical protein
MFVSPLECYIVSRHFASGGSAEVSLMRSAQHWPDASPEPTALQSGSSSPTILNRRVLEPADFVCGFSLVIPVSVPQRTLNSLLAPPGLH